MQPFSLASAVATASLLCSAPACADNVVTVAEKNAELCFENYAEDVERSDDELLTSVTFLVMGVCAYEVTLAEQALVDKLEREKTLKLDEACGVLPEHPDRASFDVFSEIDFEDEAARANYRKIEQCRRDLEGPFSNIGFNSSAPVKAQTSQLTSKASQALLNKRIARLDAAPTGDK